jgi:hypothetical protein
MVRNIFIEKNVNCPVCKGTFQLKYPNPKLYAAASRDEDRRVTAYTWARGLQTLVEMLQQTVTSDITGSLQSVGSSADSAAAEWRKHIADITPKWPDMPRTEETCIKRAVEAFDYSYKYEDTGQGIEQSLAVVNLIVKLLLKLGDLEGALNYASQIFKSGFRDKQELQRQLSQAKQAKMDKSLKNFDERGMLRKIATVNKTLAQAGEIRKKILGMIYEKNKEKILPILKESVEKSPQEQKQALLATGINEELIPFLREKGLIKTEETQKKGWFGKKK